MKALLLLLSLSACLSCLAAEQRTARVLWQGVGEFGKAKVTNAMSSAIRRPGAAGGVMMPAIFLHPNNEARALAQFPPVHVGLDEGQRVFFVGYVGLSDGIKWDDPVNRADGARCYVSFGGQDVASAEVSKSEWLPLAAQLYESRAAGGVLEGAVALATDSGGAGNASYDWAMFGEPMVVVVDGRPLAESIPVSGVNGVCIAQVEGGAGSVIVEGLDQDGRPLEGVSQVLPVGQGETGLRCLRFDFAGQPRCAQWQWRAEGVRVASAWGGSLEPRLVLEHVGPRQAVTVAGETLLARAVVRNDGPGALLPEHGAHVECNGQRQDVPRLAPDERANLDFDLGIPDAGETGLRATALVGGAGQGITSSVVVWPSLPRLPEGRPEKARAERISDEYLVLENRHCRWLIHSGEDGLGALVYSWVDDRWELVGTVSPWLTVMSTGTPGHGIPGFPDIDLRQTDEGAELVARSESTRFTYSVAATLPADSAAMRVETAVEAKEEAGLAAVWGPAVHPGDRSTGAGKGIAVFPGLEYLEGEEASSSTRDLAPPLNERWTPHRFKITVPMMMVETRPAGPVVAVAWDANQQWDGEHGQPATRFASPNSLTHQDNHLLQLGLPSVPELIPESQDRAPQPLPMAPGQPWKLVQYVVAAKPLPDATAALEQWVSKFVGYPEAEAWPRSFEEEMALCRHGFLVTVWDAEAKKSRHVVGWASANAPGMAALMLMDARSIAQGEVKAELLERVKLIADQTVEQEGVGALASSACCHTMGGEFPYHWGHLPGGIGLLKTQAYRALRGQEDDGGWGYSPDKERERLGAPGTRVMGIAGPNAYLMARWVAISGDPVMEEGLRRALKHMEQYHVPRGAQGWECPILEPDVLASAYAVRAYVWSYMALGEEALLDRARFWARTGLPFQYSWDDGERPGMRYSSIPVFGSTFFTHTWIGLPVQWCGLVYAYGLQELMRFDKNDLWRKQVEGMVASATHQQWPLDNAELAGTYPDSYGQWFTVRNPVHINPENIQLNAMALRGLDPGLRSVAVRMGDGLVHVTAAADVKAVVEGEALRLDARYVPGETFYLTVAPVAPAEGARVIAGGATLSRRDALAPGETGWAYDARERILAIGVRAGQGGAAVVTLTGIARSVPEAPKPKTGWDFDEEAEGWVGDHSCQVRAKDGSLVITVTGEDPYAISGPALIDARTHKSVKVRARLTAGGQLGLFWRTSRSPGWGPDKEVYADVPTDGQWHEVAFDLSSHPLWSGTVEEIRFDPEPTSVAAGTVLEIDWIRAE